MLDCGAGAASDDDLDLAGIRAAHVFGGWAGTRAGATVGGATAPPIRSGCTHGTRSELMLIPPTCSPRRTTAYVVCFG